MSWTGEGWLAAGEPLGDRLDPDGVARLRPLRGLNIRWPSSRVPIEVITVLAAAGVPLHAAATPAWVEPELAGLLAAWTPEEGDGDRRSVTDLRREEHSVRLRRHGLRSRAGAATAALPKVSVVMSSMRPNLLASALGQIARQRRVEVEVLLGLHGVPAEHEEVRRAVREFDLPITVVEAARRSPSGRCSTGPRPGRVASTSPSGTTTTGTAPSTWPIFSSRAPTPVRTSWAPRPSSSTWSRSTPRSAVPTTPARSGPSTWPEARSCSIWPGSRSSADSPPCAEGWTPRS
ncbi:hypothetical protein ACFQX6_31075 [Streptosporangium lutulentum]